MLINSFYKPEEYYGSINLYAIELFFVQKPPYYPLGVPDAYNKLLNLVSTRLVEQLLDLGGCLDSEVLNYGRSRAR